MAVGEVQPPRRLYMPELVYFYEAALSSNSASAKFLSLYQVLEYFFENVVREKIVLGLRDAITGGIFSSKEFRHRGTDRDCGQVPQTFA